jgi:peptidoglycan/LPS O-acetylase OafA/YrhL
VTTTARAPARARRFPELDGMRALAVTGALILHSKIGWFPCIGLGVDVFFVLSGFLITDILVRERLATGRINIRSFYRRRAFRLLPALFVLLVTVDTLSVLFSGANLRDANLRTTVRVLTYSENWMPGFPGSLAHLWTLSVEEQFYLVWPIVLVLVLRGFHGRLRTSAAAAVLAGLALLDLVYMALTAHFQAFGSWRITAGTDTHCHGLLIGSAAAFALSRSDGSHRSLSAAFTRRLAPICFAALLGVGLCPGSSLFMQEFGDGIVIIAAAGLVVAVVGGDPGPIGQTLSAPFLTYIGRISYSLYLWHFPIYVVLDDSAWWPHHAPLQWLAKAVFPLAAAAASYRFVERPALRYQARRFPRRAPRRYQAVELATP